MDTKNQIEKYINQIEEMYNKDLIEKEERRIKNAEFIKFKNSLPKTSGRQMKNPYLPSVPSGVSEEYKMIVNDLYNFLKIKFSKCEELEELKEHRNTVNNGWQYKNIEIISILNYFLQANINTKKVNYPNENIEIQYDFYNKIILLEDLIEACKSLLNNFMYKNVVEDVRNDYIRDLLGFKATEYNNIADQSRSGTSSKGKSAGESDLFIKLKNGDISIIEGMNLKSVHKEYISEHVNKIFNYDTLGNTNNYVLSYVKTEDFDKFIKRYFNYLEKHTYPKDIELLNMFVDDKYNYPELRCIKTELKRNDMPINIYHIVMHFR